MTTAPDPRFELEGSTGDREDLYYSGPIVDAFFAEGQFGVALNLITAIDTPERFPFLNDPSRHTRFFGLGQSQDGKWVTQDGGARVAFERADGMIDEDKKLNARSQVGKLIAHIAKTPELRDALPASWTAKDARGWIGLWVDWNATDVPASKPKLDPQTGAELRDKNGRMQFFQTTEVKAMPVAMRASGAAPVSVPSTSGGATEGNGQVVAQGDFDLTTLPCDAETLGHLRGVAVLTDGGAKFLGEALKVPGVAGDNALVAVLGGDGRDNIWLTLRNQPA